MLKTKHTVTEMKNAFDELINTVDWKQTSENLVKLEIMSIKMSKTSLKVQTGKNELKRNKISKKTGAITKEYQQKK